MRSSVGAAGGASSQSRRFAASSTPSTLATCVDSSRSVAARASSFSRAVARRRCRVVGVAGGVGSGSGSGSGSAGATGSTTTGGGGDRARFRSTAVGAGAVAVAGADRTGERDGLAGRAGAGARVAPRDGRA